MASRAITVTVPGFGGLPPFDGADTVPLPAFDVGDPGGPWASLFMGTPIDMPQVAHSSLESTATRGTWSAAFDYEFYWPRSDGSTVLVHGVFAAQAYFMPGHSSVSYQAPYLDPMVDPRGPGTVLEVAPVKCWSFGWSCEWALPVLPGLPSWMYTQHQEDFPPGTLERWCIVGGVDSVIDAFSLDDRGVLHVAGNDFRLPAWGQGRITELRLHWLAPLTGQLATGGGYRDELSIFQPPEHDPPFPVRYDRLHFEGRHWWHRACPMTLLVEADLLADRSTRYLKWERRWNNTYSLLDDLIYDTTREPPSHYFNWVAIPDPLDGFEFAGDPPGGAEVETAFEHWIAGAPEADDTVASVKGTDDTIEDDPVTGRPAQADPRDWFYQQVDGAVSTWGPGDETQNPITWLWRPPAAWGQGLSTVSVPGYYTHVGGPRYPYGSPYACDGFFLWQGNALATPGGLGLVYAPWGRLLVTRPSDVRWPDEPELRPEPAVLAVDSPTRGGPRAAPITSATALANPRAAVGPGGRLYAVGVRQDGALVVREMDQWGREARDMAALGGHTSPAFCQHPATRALVAACRRTSDGQMVVYHVSRDTGDGPLVWHYAGKAGIVDEGGCAVAALPDGALYAARVLDGVIYTHVSRDNGQTWAEEA